MEQAYAKGTEVLAIKLTSPRVGGGNATDLRGRVLQNSGVGNWAAGTSRTRPYDESRLSNIRVDYRRGPGRVLRPRGSLLDARRGGASRYSPLSLRSPSRKSSGSRRTGCSGFKRLCEGRSPSHNGGAWPSESTRGAAIARSCPRAARTRSTSIRTRAGTRS